MNIDGLESMDIFKKSYVIERVIKCSLNAFLLYAFVIIIQADSMELNILIPYEPQLYGSEKWLLYFSHIKQGCNTLSFLSLLYRMRNHWVILQVGPATSQRYGNLFPSHPLT